ncbi:hypothetical protein CBL_01165 [Carabus blaptoides fortunei]
MVALLFPLNTAVPKGQRHVHLKRPMTMCAGYLVRESAGDVRVQETWMRAANGEDGRGRLPHRFLLPSPIIEFVENDKQTVRYGIVESRIVRAEPHRKKNTAAIKAFRRSCRK